MKKDIRSGDDCGLLLAAAKSPYYWIPKKPHGGGNFPIKFQSKFAVNHKKQNHRKSSSLVMVLNELLVSLKMIVFSFFFLRLCNRGILIRVYLI